MVPVISIGPFRGFLFGHHPPVMPAGAATEGVSRDDPTRMPDGTLVGPSGMRGRSGARHGIGSEDGGHDMLVVAEPPSPLPRGPCPRAMRAAKSNVMRCKRMAQGRDPPDDGGEYVAQPRLKHSLRNQRAGYIDLP